MKPYYQDDYVTLYHGDCREIVPTLGKFDLLLTDPPYGAIGGSKAIGGSGFVKANEYDLSWDIKTISHADLDTIIAAGKQHIIWGVNYFWDYFKPTNGLLVWDKKCQNDWNDTFSDAEMAWTDCSTKLKMFRYLWVGALKQGNEGKRVHPTQKPIALMTWCIKQANTPATIIDPYAGAGATGRAAKDLQRKCTLIELEERYCEVAANRLRQEVLPLECE
jgi:site-specific DNA-methyltransferase (adenine-specific)